MAKIEDQSYLKISLKQIPCESLALWKVLDFPHPSFWAPRNFDKNSQRERGENIAFDGIDLSLEKSGEISEFGFNAYLPHGAKNNPSQVNWPTNYGCSQVFLKDLTDSLNLFEDGIGDQDIFYDTKTKVVKWTYDKNIQPENYYLIAQNVAVGIHQGLLHEILGKISN